MLDMPFQWPHEAQSSQKVGILRAPFELYVQQCSYLNIYLQEPGVYMVFVTAILQDACLSIKVASNLAEREVPDSQPFLL